MRAFVVDHGLGQNHPVQDDVPERPRTPPEQRKARIDDLDLLKSIPDMYRLLDLVLEQGSGGLGMCKQNSSYVFHLCEYTL